MSWRVIYHHEAAKDLEDLGKSQARAVLKTIETRIQDGNRKKPECSFPVYWLVAAVFVPVMFASSTAFRPGLLKF